MFERFTGAARGVVQDAVARVEVAGAERVTDEHLLLALLDRCGTQAADALAELGVDRNRPALEQALAEGRRRGGISRMDAEALAGLGIDVAEVVARTEDSHGQGALAGGRVSGRGRSRRHRRFTNEAKAVLERALRAAIERDDRHIGDEHVLLGLATGPGLIADVLAEFGAARADVERVLGDGGKGKPRRAE